MDREDTMDEANGQEKRLSVLETNFSHVSQTLRGLNESINSGFSGMREAMEEQGRALHHRVDRVEQRSQVSWPLIISVIVLLTILCGGLLSFVSMTVKPVRETGQETKGMLMARILQLNEDYEAFGYNRARIEALTKEVTDLNQRIHTVEQRTSESKADRDALHKRDDDMREWLRDIDMGRSQGWNKTATERE